MEAPPRTGSAPSAAMLTVLDPATDAPVGQVPNATRRDVVAALEAAAEAQRRWADTDASLRAEVVAAIAAGLRAERTSLARLITLEQGKPLTESEAEVDYAASFFDVASRTSLELGDESLEVTGKRVQVEYRPIGPTAAITPWNFPLAMLAKKAAAAIAVGCSQVVKPAEQTPLTAVRFGEIANQAGVPDDVLHIVTGQPEEIGEALFQDQRLRKISFTGSTEVGRLLMTKAAARVLPLSLELGGHAPLIVFDDADLDDAVDLTMVAKFRNGGQTCIAPNRILVQSGIHDRYVDALAERAEALRSGRGLDEVDLGPIIDDAGMSKIQRHIEDAVERGGRAVLGGGLRTIPGLTNRFPEPTIILDTGPEMQCWQEETFGPVCPIRRFETEMEAVDLANRTPYGLAGYVSTGSAELGRRVARALEFGIVGVNDPRPAIADVPFGGVKASGFGREGGRLGLEDYLVPVTVSEVR